MRYLVILLILIFHLETMAQLSSADSANAYAFLEDFRAKLIANDTMGLIAMTQFPLEYIACSNDLLKKPNPKTEFVPITADNFKWYYTIIFSPKVRKCILTTPIDEVLLGGDAERKVIVIPIAYRKPPMEGFVNYRFESINGRNFYFSDLECGGNSGRYRDIYVYK